jgi:hypothetical protein
VLLTETHITDEKFFRETAAAFAGPLHLTLENHKRTRRFQADGCCVALRRAGDSMCKQHTFAPARLVRLASASPGTASPQEPVIPAY